MIRSAVAAGWLAVAVGCQPYPYAVRSTTQVVSDSSSKSLAVNGIERVLGGRTKVSLQSVLGAVPEDGAQAVATYGLAPGRWHTQIAISYIHSALNSRLGPPKDPSDSEWMAGARAYGYFPERVPLPVAELPNGKTFCGLGPFDPEENYATEAPPGPCPIIEELIVLLPDTLLRARPQGFRIRIYGKYPAVSEIPIDPWMIAAQLSAVDSVEGVLARHRLGLTPKPGGS